MTRHPLGLLVVSAMSIALLWALPSVARPAASATTTKVTVTEGKPFELRYTLSKTSVPKGTVVFTVVDKGKLGHDFKVCSSPSTGSANACKGKGTKVVPPGKSTTLTIVFPKAGKYEYLCTVAGHAAAGMKGILKVS
jgi:uncharacterized cupredoxin-like copper-binding protein